MTDQVEYLPRHSPGPETVVITACEVLTWIAFGKAQTREAFNNEELAPETRWGTLELPLVLEALEARAAPAPYCAVRWIGHLRDRAFVEKSLSPAGPSALRKVSVMARRRHGRWVPLAELVSELRTEIEWQRLANRRFQRATADLARRLQSEDIKAFGQQTFPDGSPDPRAVTGRIPSDIFKQDGMGVNAWDEVAIDPDLDRLPWAGRIGALYSGVRFMTSDVLGLWPAQSRPLSATASAWMWANMAPRADGKRMKRPEALIRCREETLCTEKEARAALGQLPLEWRNPRGAPKKRQAP